MRPDRGRLGDILEAIERIRERFPGTFKEFASSKLIQVWAVHHLLVIGGATNSLSPGLMEAHPEIPGRKIIDMRHAPVQQYFGSDRVAVWRTITVDLAALETLVRAILEDLP